MIDRAEGCYLFDAEGNRYLDGVCSLWCNVHGHRHPALDAAIRDQLDKVAHSTLLGLTHAPAIELARRLVELAPEGLTRVFFSDDGATAVEVALKMAFQYWRQKADPEPAPDPVHRPGRRLPRRHAGRRQRRRRRAVPRDVRPAAVPRRSGPRRRIATDARWGCRGTSAGSPAWARSRSSCRRHPGEVAAVVVEPLVQGAAGMIVHPEGYLKGLRDLTRKHGTLLIADEVAVGFGRTGTLFACEQEGVTPRLPLPGQGAHRRLSARWRRP